MTDDRPKILIVDDYVENLVALERTLADTGAELVRAMSGNEALALTLEHDFALAILDVQMPEMDGYETATLMRQEEKTRILPIIFVSAVYSSDYYTIKGIEAGAVDFIAKPFPPAVLAGKVRVFLDLHAKRLGLEREIEIRRQVEEELRRHRDHLSELVDQATAEIRQREAQLRRVQKLESIGTLAGGVAHEINNPIMGIMNYAQLIIDRLGPDSNVAEFATEIGRETQRVATIVRNLLSFARHEKQQHRLARVCDIVEGTLSLVRAVLRHDQITLEVDVPEDLPAIRCRSQQIQQVVMNLITNARDTLNEKYPGYDNNKRVSISASLFERADHQWIRITVEDSGVGIPADVRERMFDPFYTTKLRHEGTGLGLSISHGIVKDHGGELTVESEVGQWTRFHMDLPVNDRSQVEDDPADGTSRRGEVRV